MPSALRASRDFVANALARVRSGVEEYERQSRQPGPEIKVEPFDAHNVSTPAGLIKLGTSIAAARRRKANLQEAQQDVELEREKNREQIALIRAQTKYALGEGRQGEGPTTLTKGPYAGHTAAEAATILQTERIKDSRAAAADRNRRIGRVTAAREGIRQIEASVARDTEGRATLDMATWAPVFERAVSTDENTREKALAKLGINVSDFEDEFTTAAQRVAMLQAARQRLRSGITARNRMAVSNYFQPQREQYQSIIDEGVEGFGLEGEGDPNDPLGIDPLGLGVGGP